LFYGSYDDALVTSVRWQVVVNGPITADSRTAVFTDCVYNQGVGCFVSIKNVDRRVFQSGGFPLLRVGASTWDGVDVNVNRPTVDSVGLCRVDVCTVVRCPSDPARCKLIAS